VSEVRYPLSRQPSETNDAYLGRMNECAQFIKTMPPLELRSLEFRGLCGLRSRYDMRGLVPSASMTLDEWDALKKPNLLQETVAQQIESGERCEVCLLVKNDVKLLSQTFDGAPCPINGCPNASA
jgi:hypothetical protein